VYYCLFSGEFLRNSAILKKQNNKFVKRGKPKGKKFFAFFFNYCCILCFFPKGVGVDGREVVGGGVKGLGDSVGVGVMVVMGGNDVNGGKVGPIVIMRCVRDNVLGFSFFVIVRFRLNVLEWDRGNVRT
jgi:hypothetical protein